MKPLSSLIAAATVAAATIGYEPADACTRIVYRGTDNLYIIGRSLDWKTPIPTNVYVYPRGMHKVGAPGPGAIEWTSKYGAVYAVSYDAGVSEGMNERGLSVNGLFCKGTTYTNNTNDGRAPISLAMFPAWILDMCETTQDVENLLAGQNFSLYGASFDGGTATTLHWGVTDRSGRTIIIEFQNGVMNIYTDVTLPCMTNDPDWPSMKAIVKYWENIGGQKALPGSVSSPDRCVRGNYFAQHVQAVGDADEGASICRTVLNTCCVPYTYNTSTDGEPNVSMTQWRSFSNLRDLRYYFETATSNGLWYVDLNHCLMTPGSPVLKIVPTDNLNLVGDATGHFKTAKPFTPMY